MADKEDLIYSLTLHSEITGSSSQHSHEDLVQLANWLNNRMNNWKPTAIPKFALYDQAVRVLIASVLMEWERYLEEKAKAS